MPLPHALDVTGWRGCAVVHLTDGNTVGGVYTGGDTDTLDGATAHRFAEADGMLYLLRRYLAEGDSPDLRAEATTLVTRLDAAIGGLPA